MEELELIKKNLKKYNKQISQNKAKQQEYKNTVNSITEIYDRMLEDKETIISYKNSLKDFSNEEFDKFKGKLYKDIYRKKIENIIDNYNTVIKNIDSNLDNLNNVRAQYESKMYQCNGALGYLQSMANSLARKIENWTN